MQPNALKALGRTQRTSKEGIPYVHQSYLREALCHNEVVTNPIRWLGRVLTRYRFARFYVKRRKWLIISLRQSAMTACSKYDTRVGPAESRRLAADYSRQSGYNILLGGSTCWQQRTSRTYCFQRLMLSETRARSQDAARTCEVLWISRSRTVCWIHMPF